MECQECQEGMDLYCVLLNYFPVGEIGVAEKHSFMLLTIPLFATGCGNNICVTKSPVAVVTVCVEINSPVGTQTSNGRLDQVELVDVVDRANPDV